MEMCIRDRLHVVQDLCALQSTAGEIFDVDGIHWQISKIVFKEVKSHFVEVHIEVHVFQPLAVSRSSI